MNVIIKKMEHLQKAVEKAYTVLCIIAGFGLFFLLAANVFVRIFPIVSLHWFDEIVELLFAWLVFIGSSVLFSQKDHFMIQWLQEKIEDTKALPYYLLAINLVCLAFVGVFLVQGARLTMLARDWTAVINLPKKIFYLSMPLSGLFMVYTSIVELMKLPGLIGKKEKE